METLAEMVEFRTIINVVTEVESHTMLRTVSAITPSEPWRIDDRGPHVEDGRRTGVSDSAEPYLASARRALIRYISRSILAELWRFGRPLLNSGREFCTSTEIPRRNRFAA